MTDFVRVMGFDGGFKPKYVTGNGLLCVIEEIPQDDNPSYCVYARNEQRGPFTVFVGDHEELEPAIDQAEAEKDDWEMWKLRGELEKSVDGFQEALNRKMTKKKREEWNIAATIICQLTEGWKKP